MDFQIRLEVRGSHYLSKAEKQLPATKGALNNGGQLVQISSPLGTFGLFLSPLSKTELLSAEAHVCPPVIQQSLLGEEAGFS